MIGKMVILLSLALASLAPAQAGESRHGPHADRVVFTLQAEDWVKTRTARVVISINAALKGEDAGRVRALALSSLDKLVSQNKPAWRITGFNRSSDAAGLERWRITAQSRLPESALGGLQARARRASRAGPQLRISQIDFTPTLAEREVVRARLRSRIYAMARAEIKRLKAAWPDRSYRVGQIDFTSHYSPPAMAKRLMARAPQAEISAFDSGGGVNVSQKLRARATIMLVAPVAAQNSE